MSNRRARQADFGTLVLLAAASWFGVLLQLGLSLQRARDDGLSLTVGFIAYFGFFTIVSNIFVAVVASVRLLEPAAYASGNVRACATTAILFVGLAYHFLLRKIYDPQGWHLVANVFLHYAVPFLALVHWILFPPLQRLSITGPLKWSVYPCGYFIYVLIRGELIGTYPYFFIDVTTLGYARTIANAIGLLACFVLLGFVVRYMTRIRRPAADAAALSSAAR